MTFNPACFFYLLLGHLMGDYVFQTDVIAANKLKSWKWNLLHSAVVTVCITILAIPFGCNIIVLSLLNGVIHFLVDYYKSVISDRYKLPGLILFISDQSIHILLIFLISYFTLVNTGFTPLGAEFVKLILVIASVSSFSAVLNQYIITSVFRQNEKGFFIEGEKQIGNLTRLIITFTLYASFEYSFLFLFLLITAFMIPAYIFKTRWSKWMSRSYFSMKLSLDLIISILGFTFLILS